MLALSFQSVGFAWQDRLGSVQALHDVNFAVNSNLPVFICGPSGSGKSTLGMLAAGLVKPDAGSISFDPAPPSPQDIAFVFQFPEHLFIEDTLHEEVASLFGNCSESSVRDIFPALALDFDRLADLLTSRLSAAEGRLSAIALQLARQPRLLILDEPTIGLDSHHRRTLLSALKSIHRSDRLLLIITHELSLMRDFPGIALILSDGGVSWQGSTESLLADSDLLIRSRLLA